MNEQQLKTLLEDTPVQLAGYELLREVVLPDLLGAENGSLLYWVGKNVARKYPLQSVDDVITFFRHVHWGELELVKESNNSYEFSLTGDIITNRFAWCESPSFQLEAGFLAEQAQRWKGAVTETFEQQKARKKKVLFTVKSDLQDSDV